MVYFKEIRQRFETARESIGSLDRHKEPWPSFIMVGMLPVLAGAEMGRFGSGLYLCMRAMDDYVDSPIPLEKKASLLDRLQGINRDPLSFNPDDEENSEAKKVLIMFHSLKIQRPEDEVFTDIMEFTFGLVGKEVIVHQKKQESITANDVVILRDSGVLPWLRIGTYLMFGVDLDQDSPNYQRLVEFCRYVAMSGDIRDLKEDLDQGIVKFTEDELLIYQGDVNDLKRKARALKRQNFQNAMRMAPELRRIEPLSQFTSLGYVAVALLKIASELP